MSAATAHWTTSSTSAAKQAIKGLKVVDSLLSWVKEGQGKPSTDERNLFMAAVAFTYGVWENYVEQLAVEIVTHLSHEIPAERVPESVHQDFTKNRSTWEITVSPGWKKLWVQRVHTLALGEGNSFGINTASEGSVNQLFRSVGIEPFSGIDTVTVKRLAELIRVRGVIVHTAQVPPTLKKYDVLGWRDYVESLYVAVDASCRKQSHSLVI